MKDVNTQDTLFCMRKMSRPESNINLHFNKAVGLIDLIPEYTKEQTLLLMEVLIFLSQRNHMEQKTEHYYTDEDGNQWNTIPFSFIEDIFSYQKSKKRYIIVDMLKELVGIKVNYNFLNTDNTIDVNYRMGVATILSQVDYLEKKQPKNIKNTQTK
jgi:hypothetical protein